MKKLLLIGSLVVAMVISGCSEKSDVEVDENATNSTSQNGNNGDNANSTLSGNSSESQNNGQKDPNSIYSVYFGFDRFIVEGNENVNTIKNNAKLINESGNKVYVAGNTDEWGSEEYNYALALKRATSVKDALINNNVPADKIETISYGESKPRCTDKTKKCWKENRRVDFDLAPSK